MTAVTSSGGSISTTLTIVFIVLKLTNAIHWSWWWVFSPLLISIGLSLIMLVVACLVYLER